MKISIGSIPNIPDNYKVYNLSSVYQMGVSVHDLIPNPFGLNIDINSQEFDVYVFNTIFANERLFAIFLQMVNDVFNGNDIYIMIDDNVELKIALSESVIRIIQQRYGLEYSIVNTPEDFECVEETKFSFIGIQIFDQDNKRFMFCLNKLGVVDYEQFFKSLPED